MLKRLGICIAVLVPSASGLAVAAEGDEGKAPTPASGSSAEVALLPPITVIAPSPLIGSGVDRDTVPGETHVLTSKDISRDGTPDAVRSLNQQLGGVTLNAAAGNPLQPTLLYHGFAASPLQRAAVRRGKHCPLRCHHAP